MSLVSDLCLSLINTRLDACVMCRPLRRFSVWCCVCLSICRCLSVVFPCTSLRLFIYYTSSRWCFSSLAMPLSGVMSPTRPSARSWISAILMQLGRYYREQRRGLSVALLLHGDHWCTDPTRHTAPYRSRSTSDSLFRRVPKANKAMRKE